MNFLKWIEGMPEKTAGEVSEILTEKYLKKKIKDVVYLWRARRNF